MGKDDPASGVREFYIEWLGFCDINTSFQICPKKGRIHVLFHINYSYRLLSENISVYQKFQGECQLLSPQARLFSSYKRNPARCTTIHALHLHCLHITAYWNHLIFKLVSMGRAHCPRESNRKEVIKTYSSPFHSTESQNNDASFCMPLTIIRRF